MAYNGNDVFQFGHGVINFGTWRSYGAARTPFVRCATVPTVGNASITITTATSDWKVGDVIVIPDSRQLSDANRPNPQFNMLTYHEDKHAIAGISADHKTFLLDSTLGFTHPGARDKDSVLVLCPHAVNISRNVRLSSANPTGTRGHSMTIGRWGQTNLNYTAFLNMARTKNTDSPLPDTSVVTAHVVASLAGNQKGRYYTHVHHVQDNAGTVNGCVMNGSDDFTLIAHWGGSIHDTNNFQWTNNVHYNLFGWGIGTEDGDETNCNFTGNFFMAIFGFGVAGAAGIDGAGIWVHSCDHTFNNNVFAACQEGIIWWQFDLPTSWGKTIISCDNNEVYNTTRCMECWELGVDNGGQSVVSGYAGNTISNTVFWNCGGAMFYSYPSYKLTVDTFAIYCDPDAGVIFPSATGFGSNDYACVQCVLKNLDFHNVGVGVQVNCQQQTEDLTPAASFVVQDSFIHAQICFDDIGEWSSGGAHPGARSTTVRNVTAEQYVAGNQNAFYRFQWGTTRYPTPVDSQDSRNAIASQKVFFEQWQGSSSINFRVFIPEQKGSYVLQQSTARFLGSSSVGLTNTQNLATLGICTFNEINNDTTTTRTGFKCSNVTDGFDVLFNAYCVND